MRHSRIGIALVMTAVAFAGACSAFSDSDDAETPPTADADASDATSSQDVTTSTDANVDAGDGSAPCTTFEDDFGGDLAKWEPSTANCEDGGVGFVSHDAGDHGVSLGCSGKVSEGYQVLVAGTYPVAARTRVSFSFKIGATDSHVFAQLLHLFGGFGENLSLVANGMQIEIWDRRAGAMLTSWAASDLAGWRSMVLELSAKDPAGAVLSLRAELDGVEKTVDIARDLDGGMSTFRLQIGVYANVSGGDFQNAYDDVRVSSCP